MTAQEKKEDTKKVYDYDDIVISLENSILPSEKLDETPSMKDGLDRDTENDIRFYGCELIQISGLLLKLPQVLNSRHVVWCIYFVRTVELTEIHQIQWGS